MSGTIDWPRRFDHMQQHTGQHVLSQAFLQVLRAQTVAVHMAQTCTVDLAIPEFDADGLARVERLANTVVMENRRVTTREVDADEAAGLGLRRPPKQTGLIRVVEIEGFDRSACGGTHVRATAEAGPIVVRGWEHYKGGVRAEFLCGWRALADYRQARGVVRDVTAQLTTGEADVTAALARLRERARALERDLEAARKIVLDHEAGTMIGSIPSGSGPIVACALGGRSIEDARILARAITARPGLIAVLAIEQDRRVVIARSSDVGLDAAALLRETVAPFGGRGGGRPEMAEGAAPAAPSADALVEHARAAARERLGRP